MRCICAMSGEYTLLLCQTAYLRSSVYLPVTSWGNCNATTLVLLQCRIYAPSMDRSSTCSRLLYVLHTPKQKNRTTAGSIVLLRQATQLVSLENSVTKENV